MLIDFEKIEENVTSNFKGGEKDTALKAFFDGAVRIMKGRLEPGASIGMHTHEGNYEIIYVLKGKGKVIYDGDMEVLCEGSCHYCPEGHTHSLRNDSGDDLIFFAVIPKAAE